MARKANWKRPDTQVQIWAPPATDDAAEQDSYGAIDRSAANWTKVGQPYWVYMSTQSASDTPIAGQASSGQVQEVRMEYVANFSLDWRLEILNGPNAGRYLYPSSPSYEGASIITMTLLCRLARKT